MELFTLCLVDKSLCVHLAHGFRPFRLHAKPGSTGHWPKASRIFICLNRLPQVLIMATWGLRVHQQKTTRCLHLILKSCTFTWIKNVVLMMDKLEQRQDAENIYARLNIRSYVCLIRDASQAAPLFRLLPNVDWFICY